MTTTVVPTIYAFARTLGELITPPGAAILVYHSLSSRQDSYSFSLAEFESHIAALAKRYRFRTLSEIVAAHAAGKAIDGVAITFDDGYRDILRARPLLAAYGIKPTAFVLSTPLRADRKELDHPGTLLTDLDVRKLGRAGWEIGCHSATHADFSMCSLDELFTEINLAKKRLERKLQHPVTYFAYPKGMATTDAMQAVKYADYEAAFGIDFACVTAKSSRFDLPRIIIDRSYNQYTLADRVSSGVQQMRQLTKGRYRL